MRSDIASSGEVVGCLVTTTLVDLGLLATVLTFMVAFFLGFTVAGLKAAVILGTCFLGLAVFFVVYDFILVLCEIIEVFSNITAREGF